MFNIVEIVKNDWATYYNFASGEKTPPVTRTFIIVVAAGVLSLFAHANHESFLNAILSIEAILVGFSFSVMFFLLSEERAVDQDDAALETGIRRKKLHTLSREIFYNVSYFNLVSILCVLIALILLLPSYSLGPQNFLTQLSFFLGIDFFSSAKLGLVMSEVVPIISWLLWTCLYFFLAQSIFTLIRTVGRVHFYFSEKIALAEKSDD